MDAWTEIASNLDVDENIVYTIVHNEVNMKRVHNNEEKKMLKLFHTKVQEKNVKVDALFNTRSHANLIAEELVIKFGLEVPDHPHPYPLRMLSWKLPINVYLNFPSL